MRNLIAAIILSAVVVAAPARANFVTEPTFAQLMTQAELVLIGTVTATDAGQYEFGSTATLDVISSLKGEARGAVTVSTYSRIAELSPRCCERGATYLMFLTRSAGDGQLHSVWGAYGMIRIGGPPGRGPVVCPTADVRSCPRGVRAN